MADLKSREHPWFSTNEQGVFVPQPRAFKSKEEQDSIAKFNEEVKKEIAKNRKADLRAKITLSASLASEDSDSDGGVPLPPMPFKPACSPDIFLKYFAAQLSFQKEVQYQMDKRRAREASLKTAHLAILGYGGSDSEQGTASPRLENESSTTKSMEDQATKLGAAGKRRKIALPKDTAVLSQGADHELVARRVAIMKEAAPKALVGLKQSYMDEWARCALKKLKKEDDENMTGWYERRHRLLSDLRFAFQVVSKSKSTKPVCESEDTATDVKPEEAKKKSK
ncbi:hypothetical protein LTR56_009313 [Elasticomyces elasticus]|nr:hypothetical protein LTR56_009313 [Elasticomyces elasticus]KAK3666373.1 hypothetical protein LTR22_002677 [Elasticomyces elasticus]KAK4917752.1 hypothetical protein LTR49_014429 [Elasticomyces elasticus]KAK5766313.1 hypothetical protein LTS12_003524 [Elasticomyces elasticus]